MKNFILIVLIILLAIHLDTYGFMYLNQGIEMIKHLRWMIDMSIVIPTESEYSDDLIDLIISEIVLFNWFPSPEWTTKHFIPIATSPRRFPCQARGRMPAR